MHIRGMTLNHYLETATMTEADFAKLIGSTQSTVNRLRKGQIPSRDLMVSIVKATDGQVTANDFFGVAA